MDTDNDPPKKAARKPTWTQPPLFDDLPDGPKPLRDLLVEWAVGYSPADPED